MAVRVVVVMGGTCDGGLMLGAVVVAEGVCLQLCLVWIGLFLGFCLIRAVFPIKKIGSGLFAEHSRFLRPRAPPALCSVM